MTTRRFALLTTLSGLLQAACGGGGSDSPTPAPAPGTGTVPPASPAAGPPVWSGHAGNAQHTALSAAATQPLNRIVWSTPVDLVPPYRSSGSLLIHYGSPLVTGAGTLLVPVKTTSTGNFRVEARRGSDGALVWQLDSDYVLPASSWTPSFNLAVDANNRLYVPAAGGRLRVREQADSNAGSVRTLAFYGDAVYAASAAELNTQVLINTPLTVDAAGNVYFGFIATPGNAARLSSGIARVAADGSAVWRGVFELTADTAIAKPAMNCAPALSNDGQTVYIAVNANPVSGVVQSGYLLALDATTLALRTRQALREPRTGVAARISDSSSASPTVGPDGDVYYGVLDGTRDDHNGRGWLLHFDAMLGTVKTPGSFGWDDTPSIVPAAMVPDYTGTSSYLLLVKYNNYYGAGRGDGRNQMAVLDPQGTQADAYTPAGAQVTVMKEVRVVTGPTPDPGTVGGVREWCVNTAAVDPATNSVLVNNEDGVLYRWHLPSNTLSEGVRMNAGVGQAYTATVVGPDGLVYAINNAQLHAVGR